MAEDKNTENETPATKTEALPDDPIVTYIMAALESGDLVSPNAIAQTIARDRATDKTPADLWLKFMTAVRQQAIHLARVGRIEIIRRGKVADPNDFKGLYKLRLPRK